MTSENWITIIGITGALGGVVVGALLNHFLERNRNRSFSILNKKIDTYSSLLVKLSTVFQDGEKNILTDPNFMETIRVTLAKSLSEARLIANPPLEEKLRAYYDEAVKFWGNKPHNMSAVVEEIEQLMREEIGQKRLR